MILNEKQQKSVSKFLSLILRHRPEQIGITLDKNGWVDIDILLTQANHPKAQLYWRFIDVRYFNGNC